MKRMVEQKEIFNGETKGHNKNQYIVAENALGESFPSSLTSLDT